MALRKKTLRKLPPTARKVARMIAELESVSRRLKNLLEDLARLERESQALWKAHPQPPLPLD